MERLNPARLKLNREKCVFGSCHSVTRIKFLGRIFTVKGLEPDDTKIEAIKKLGMVKYLGKFIKNLAELTYPLHELQKNRNKWLWT
jgi:hypothetical protein